MQKIGGPDIHGDKSIEVLGLNRLALVEARKEMLNEIDVDLLRIRTFTNSLMQVEAATRKTLLPFLDDLLSALIRRKNKDRAYSAFASAYIDAQLRELEQDLANLR